MDGAPQAARVACCRPAAAVVDLPVVHEAREAAPIFLLSRSVGQVGTNTNTLGITRFQLEIRAFAGAAPDEFYVPSGAPDETPRNRLRMQIPYRQLP